MAKKLKIGVIGSGTIGRVHARHYFENPHVDLVVFSDIIAAKSRVLADDFKAECFNNTEKMFARHKLDAVSVCTPNDSHMPITLLALKHGCHVLCEKPMALNARQAAAMTAGARKKRKLLMLGMKMRFEPEAVYIKDQIRRGTFGDIYHVDISYIRHRGIPGLGGWFTTKSKSGGGPLIDIGVHIIDLALHLTGFPKPVAVSAATYDRFGPRMKKYTHTAMWAGPANFKGVFDVEDLCTALYRFDNGMTMALKVAWACNMKTTSSQGVALFGDKAGARLGFGQTPVIFTEHNGYLTDFTPTLVESNAYKTEIDHFVDCILKGKKPIPSARQGTTLMKLLDATYRSAAQGREVKIPR